MIAVTEDRLFQRFKIADGWHDEGRGGIILGDPVFVGQHWTPVLFDDQEDPEFLKTAAVSMDGNGRREKSERPRDQAR